MKHVCAGEREGTAAIFTLTPITPRADAGGGAGRHRVAGVDGSAGRDGGGGVTGVARLYRIKSLRPLFAVPARQPNHDRRSGKPQ